MNKKPIIAFLYDFDKTLCTTDMQDYTFIPSLGYTPGEFWSIANSFGFENRMDGLLAYMYTMIEECRKKGIRLDRDYLVSCGHAIELFPGVQDWFSRINAFGETLGVEIEHYVLSSGLREIIEGSGVSHEFKEIYACEFFYNEKGLASWPKLDVNFTNKTQFVYRINKGILDVAKDKELNASMPDDSKRIPFTNMIYIGDGLSDVPCMKMMRAYGGQAIAVYQATNRAGVEDLLAKGRVDYIFQADYRAGSALEATVQDIIRKMAVTDRLWEENARQVRSIGGDVLLGQVGLPNPELVAKRYPHTMSGGQRQRVMIAMAMACNPKILFADEPTTALDVTIQAQILELLKKLNRESGISMLFISHNLNVVRKLCTRTAVMQRGVLVEEGDIETVFRHPRHPYTQRLIAAIPTRHRKEETP